MNDAPKSRLTPADRDAAAFEATRLRALSLRREAVNAFWGWVGAAALRAVGRGARTLAGAIHTAREATARAVFRSHRGA